MASSFLLGVNLAGAEFGESHVPGTFGTDYTYPTHAEIDYYASKGMSVIRLPFLWERIQHSQNGSLDSVELGRLDDVMSYTTGKGLKIEIEPHNYGYGFGALIGTAQTPNAAFADVWGKLALHFKSNADVIFGLMNEPHDQSASDWLGSANAAIAAIRNAGASQEILVPGSYWDGAWTWTSTDNAAVIGSGVQDSAHNFAFEVHQYLDADGSGTHSGVVSATIGVERLTAITQWAEANGKHLFLGEVGVATDQTSLTALDGMLTYMQQHTSVWQGVTYWAGGPWWGNYMFSIEPQNDTDKPQMDILEQHLTLTNHLPLVSASDIGLSAHASVPAASLFSASDADGNTLFYDLLDTTSASTSGHFVVNGVVQNAFQDIVLTQSQLAQASFVAGTTPDDLAVNVFDGIAWSGWTHFDASPFPDHPPTGLAPDIGLSAHASVPAASLFSASDADGDTLFYDLLDATSASSSGHFVVNGVVQNAFQDIVLTQSQLAQISFVAGTTPDDLAINVFDGTAWSGWTHFNANPFPNHPPTGSAPDIGLSAHASVPAGSLFSASDADGDTLFYDLLDTTSASTSGHFVANGVVQNSFQDIVLTQSQLAQTSFVAGTTPDDLAINVFDGTAWSGWTHFHANPFG
jgi:endoglucanase